MLHLNLIFNLMLQKFVALYMLPVVNKNTRYDYYSFCRDVAKFKKNPVIFEGSSETIVLLQIDKSIFDKQCKYH